MEKLSVIGSLVVDAVAAVLASSGALSLATSVPAAVLLVFLLATTALARRAGGSTDVGRRRLLIRFGMIGLAGVAAGAGIGRVARRLAAADPRPSSEAMARALGTEYMQAMLRGFQPARSGDILVVTTPYTIPISGAAGLVPRDPRSNHTSVWNCPCRVPLVVHGPGIVPRSRSEERVTVADMAPTIAHLIGFGEFLDRDLDGRLLPGLESPSAPPRVVVTFVIDGGGWNVLERWPDAWPNLRRIMRGGADYRNAVVGAFPSMTGPVHATIGTGRFPMRTGSPGITSVTGTECGASSAKKAGPTPRTSSCRRWRTCGATELGTGRGSGRSGTSWPTSV